MKKGLTDIAKFAHQLQETASLIEEWIKDSTNFKLKPVLVLFNKHECIKINKPRNSIQFRGETFQIDLSCVFN